MSCAPSSLQIRRRGPSNQIISREPCLMSRAFLLRAAAVAALLVQVSLAAPAAQAASATESQNPDLTVTLSVPDQTTVGQTIAATLSISNNSGKIQTIMVKGIWTEPDGEETVQ